MMQPVTVTVRETNGHHVRVTVRGDGEEGQRPLLGTLTMSPDEAAWLTEAVALHAAYRSALLELFAEAATPSPDFTTRMGGRRVTACRRCGFHHAYSVCPECGQL